MTAAPHTAAAAAASFDPAAWLHHLVQIGGGYALASGRKLWLVVQDCPADELTPLMAQIVGHPDRTEALRGIIELQQAGHATGLSRSEVR